MKSASPISDSRIPFLEEQIESLAYRVRNIDPVTHCEELERMTRGLKTFQTEYRKITGHPYHPPEAESD